MIVFNRDLIKNILKQKNLSYDDLSKITNMSRSTIGSIMNNTTKNPRLDTINAIYSALGLNPAQNASDSEISYFYNQLSDYSKDMVMSYTKYMLENEKGNAIPSFIKMPKNSQLERNKD